MCDIVLLYRMATHFIPFIIVYQGGWKPFLFDILKEKQYHYTKRIITKQNYEQIIGYHMDAQMQCLTNDKGRLINQIFLLLEKEYIFHFLYQSSSYITKGVKQKVQHSDFQKHSKISPPPPKKSDTIHQLWTLYLSRVPLLFR